MPDERPRPIPPPHRAARQGARTSRRTTVVELEAQMKIGQRWRIRCGSEKRSPRPDPVGSNQTVIDHASDRMTGLIESDDVIRLDLPRDLRHGAEYPLSRSALA
jgi:hypothetical protein